MRLGQDRGQRIRLRDELLRDRVEQGHHRVRASLVGQEVGQVAAIGLRMRETLEELPIDRLGLFRTALPHINRGQIALHVAVVGIGRRKRGQLPLRRLQGAPFQVDPGAEERGPLEGAVVLGWGSAGRREHGEPDQDMDRCRKCPAQFLESPNWLNNDMAWS